MLRCRGAGLFTRNARHQRYRDLCISKLQPLVDDRRIQLRSIEPKPFLHCRREYSRTTYHRRFKNGKPRKNEIPQSQSPPPSDELYAPMSDYEYEKSLWEAANFVPEAPSFRDGTASTDTLYERPLPQQQPQQQQQPQPQRQSHRPEDNRPPQKKAASKEETIKVSRLGKGQPVLRNQVFPETIPFEPIDRDVDMRVPRLAHNLDKALFNPGVFQLQDPRSKVFNFDPYLTSIMPVDEFDFDALRDYITSSKDEKLHQLCKENGSKYCGSTSSMTSLLSHFHYLISHWRPLEFPSITADFQKDSHNFTLLTRAPSATLLHHNDGVYALDSDKQFEVGRETILMELGHSLEKLLVSSPEEFEKYRRDKSHLLPPGSKTEGDEGFHYGTIGKTLMRSQLDAQDPRLPGTGVFDIKTRAVLPIRIDLANHKEHNGYEITQRFGQYESYEREYYDLIRAAFLRYSLQVRIGRMDGCFVAYHNTRRIFGFQYVSLGEMDEALHGTSDPKIGDGEFKLSVQMLERLLDMATDKYPGRKLQIHAEARPTDPPVLYFFARPIGEDEIRQGEEKAMSSIDAAQSELEQSRAELEKQELENKLVNERAGDEESNMAAKEDSEPSVTNATLGDPSASAEGSPLWEEMIAKVEEVVDNEAMGVETVRDAIQDALQNNDRLMPSSEEELSPTIEILVEALVAEMSRLRATRVSTEADSSEVEADTTAKELQTEDGATSQDQAEQVSPASETAELDQDPVATRTRELKDLILEFTGAVNENSSSARGFERALGELLSKSRPEEAAAGEQTTPEEPASDRDEEKVDITSDEYAESMPQGSRWDLFGAVVSIGNTQHGRPVTRPVHADSEGGKLGWQAHYTIHEMGAEQADSVYASVLKRRRDVFDPSSSKRRGASPKFVDAMKAITKRQAARRTKEDAGKESYHVAWDDQSHSFADSKR